MVKHGGASVMLWKCCAASGRLAIIKGNMSYALRVLLKVLQELLCSKTVIPVMRVSRLLNGSKEKVCTTLLFKKLFHERKKKGNRLREENMEHEETNSRMKSSYLM